ncbi:phosphoribosylaminoimidazolesuccinocarboxamide synthase [candidate division KSB1 bacterium]|nr:phosphoribosylaminoimidazolesuccinocarboxamide synthase [candidate division KSB1 bacterium]
MALKKKKKLYEGKTKTVFETEAPEQVIITFRDDSTGGNGGKSVTIAGKGVIDSQISCFLFRVLESYFVPTHFIAVAGKDSMLVRQMEMIPLLFITHNIASSSLARRTGAKEGKPLEKPLLEYYHKDASKRDLNLSRNDTLSTGFVNSTELHHIERCASKANAVLRGVFERRGLKVESFKLEFGRSKGRILIGDELSLENLRLLDAKTGDRLLPGRASNDPAEMQKLYEQAAQRILTDFEK